jgi:hypothetical protein
MALALSGSVKRIWLPMIFHRPSKIRVSPGMISCVEEMKCWAFLPRRFDDVFISVREGYASKLSSELMPEFMPVWALANQKPNGASGN